MSASITFDTLSAVRRLRDAGYEEKQAETIVRVIGDAQEQLVTKEHFDATMAENNVRMEGRFTLLQWMAGFNLFATIGVLWKLLH